MSLNFHRFDFPGETKKGSRLKKIIEVGLSWIDLVFRMQVFVFESSSICETF